MRKTLVIAIREYLAAVKTKSFIISLVLLPVMMSGGLIAQRVGQKFGDTSTKRVAVIDRSPGGQLFAAIEREVELRNTKGVFDEAGKQVRAKFELEKVAPADGEQADAQRLELSDRVRKGDLLAFVEIGPRVLDPEADRDDPQAQIHHSTNRATYREFFNLLQSAVRPSVVKARLGIESMSDQQLRSAEPRISDRGLAERTDGAVRFEPEQGRMAGMIVPMVMLLLLFLVVIIGASPMTGNVIEEKQLRIAEVLLGSVRPFELMMGKLIGGVAVALTLAVIYFGGAYYLAISRGLAGYIPAESIFWFLFFTIVGTFMYGSMFVAAGAAVTNIKEAQTIIMPVMVLIVLPLSLVGNMIQDPSGTLALAGSFFPFSAPMVMTARIAIPPGVPIWQTLLSAGITVATTLVLVWSAGRIFRVGILLQGQGANFAQLFRWIVKG